MKMTMKMTMTIANKGFKQYRLAHAHTMTTSDSGLVITTNSTHDDDNNNNITTIMVYR